MEWTDTDMRLQLASRLQQSIGPLTERSDARRKLQAQRPLQVMTQHHSTTKLYKARADHVP